MPRVTFTSSLQRHVSCHFGVKLRASSDGGRSWEELPSPAPPGLRAVGLLSLALVSLLTGCPPSPPGPPFPPEPPFPDDGGTVLIERDPACTLTGNLTIGLGESDGLDDFRPLPGGHAPTVHYGSQGGIHVILGTSVVNPATGFPGMQVRFTLDAQLCGANGCQQQVMGQYTTVVKQDRYIALPQGAVALSGFFVILRDWPQNSTRRVIAEVYDPCGRSGSLTLQVPAGTP